MTNDDEVEDGLVALEDRVRAAFNSVRDRLDTLQAQIDACIERIDTAETHQLDGDRRHERLSEAVGALRATVDGLAVSASDPGRRDAVVAAAEQLLARPERESGVGGQVRSAEAVRALVRTLCQDAPPGLGETLLTSREAVEDAADALRAAASSGEVELEIRVRVPRGDGMAEALMARVNEEVVKALSRFTASPEDLELKFRTLMLRDVPAIVDLCDASRRNEDTGSAFYATLEARLDELLRHAGLEQIAPERGTLYDPEEHTAIDLIQSDDDRLRDRVESCRYRGYKHDGELLKKAGVVIYR